MEIVIRGMWNAVLLIFIGVFQRLGENCCYHI